MYCAFYFSSNLEQIVVLLCQLIKYTVFYKYFDEHLDIRMVVNVLIMEILKRKNQIHWNGQTVL